MASEFDRFIEGMLGNAMGSAMQNVAPTPMRPSPSQSPFPQSSQPAAIGMPTDLVQRINQAAASALSHRAPMPSPAMDFGSMPVPQMMGAERWVDPRAMASADPVAGPPVPQKQEKIHGQAAEGESYVIVEFSDENGPHVIFVPESYAETLPQDARVISPEPVSNPVQIERARENGALLEQQPPEISAFFRNTKTSEQVYNENAGNVERPENSGVSTVVGAELTPEQRLGLKNQEPNVWTADEIEQVDPQHAQIMRANGIESYDVNNEMLVERDGKVAVIPKSEQYGTPAGPTKTSGNQEPVGTELPGLKREDIRARGMEDVANQMEAAGIYQINDGDVLIMGDDGKVTTVPAGTVPDDEVIVYGGKSKEVENDSIFRESANITGIPGVDWALTQAAPLLGPLDKPRQWATGKTAEYIAMKDSPDAPFWVKAISHTPGAQFFEGVIEGGGYILPQHLQENSVAPGLDFAFWMENNPEEAEAAYRDGYTDPDTGQTFTGYRAVWEKYSSTQPIWQRFINDIAMDPLNFAMGTGGAIRGVGRDIVGDAATTTVGRRILGGTLDAAGRVLQAPDQLMDAALSPAIRGAARGVRNTPGLRWLTEQSANTRLSNMGEQMLEAGSDLLARGRRNAPEPDPSQIGVGQIGPAPGATDNVLTHQGADWIVGPADAPGGQTFVRNTLNGGPDSPVQQIVNGVPVDATTPPLNAQQRAEQIGLANAPEPAGNGVALDDPFEGLHIGRQPKWEFAGSQDIEDIHQYTTRIIDDRWNKSGRNGDPEWGVFVQEHDPKVRYFVDQEMRSKNASMNNRGSRKGFDYKQKMASAINEARYVVEELAPDTAKVWGSDVDLPEYRFHREARLNDGSMTNKWPGMTEEEVAGTLDGLDWTKQNDDFLFERMIFDQSDASLKAEKQLRYRATKKNDELVNHFLPYASRYKKEYRQQLSHIFSDVTTSTSHPWAGTQFEQSIGKPPAPRDFAAEAEIQQAMGWENLAVSTDPRARPGTGPRQEWTDWVNRGSAPDGTSPLSPPSPGVSPAGQMSPSATVQGETVLPTNQIRSTHGMTDAELAAVGLPRLQPRSEAFSQKSVNAIVREGWDDSAYLPVLVARGTDGNYYLVSGHSRHQAATVLGRPEMRVRVTDETDPVRLAEMARRENTNVSGFTPMETAQQIRSDIDSGMTFDDIAVKHNLGSDARGTIGTGEARKYNAISHLPEGRITELVNDGTIDIDTAAIIGAGYERNLLLPEDAQAIVNKILRGDVDQFDVSRAVQRMVRNNMRPDQSTLGMIDTSFSKLDEALEQTQELMSRRNQMITELNTKYADVRNPRRSGEEAFDTSRMDDARLAEFQRDVGQIVRISDELAIPADRALVKSAKPNSDIAKMYRNDGGIDPSAQQTLFSSVIPGGPQLSDTLQRETANPNFVPESQASEFVSHDTSTMRRFMGRTLDDKTTRLVDTKFSDGDSFGSKWERTADELEGTNAPDGNPLERAAAEEIALAQTLDEYAVDHLQANYGGKKGRYEKYMAAVERLGKNNELDDASVHARAWAEVTGSKSGKGSLDVYDTTLAVLREMTLYNTLTGSRYIATQAVGNSITAFLTGNSDMILKALGARNYAGAYSQLNKNPEDLVNRVLARFIDEPLKPGMVQDAVRQNADRPAVLFHDEADQIIAELGFGGNRQDVNRVIRDQVSEDAGQQMRMKSVADNLRLGRFKIPSGWTGIFANRHIRDMANAYDTTVRKTLYAHTLDANVADARPAFKAMMEENLPRGTSVDQFNELWDTLPDTFGSDRIRDTFGEIHEGYAERMARDWQNALNKMDRNARDEVGRVFFTGDMTNADEFLKRVVFFHYWMSRATPLYTQALLRNPGYLNGYINMINAMEKEAESGRYGVAVDGLLNIFGTMRGFNIFIRPDAMLQTVFSLGQGNDFDPENETGLGTFLRKFPMFVNPIVASGANFIGLAGDTFPPDPLMVGNWSNLVTNVLNLASSHTGGGVNQNYYQNFMSWLRSETSGVLPGTSKIPFRESTMYAQRDINYLIMEVAEEQGLDPNSPEVWAAMDDHGSPLYREAYRRYADGQGMQQLARILPTSVLYPKFRTSRGDETRYNINNSNRIRFDEGSGTTVDDAAAWREQRRVAQVADPKSRELLMLGDEYYSIGTPEQRQAYSTYNAIRYGGLNEYVVIDGVYANEKELIALDPEERQDKADTWAEQNGHMEGIDDLREQRKEFNDANPQWKAYQEWAGIVRDFEGGPDEFWAQMMEGNPNASRWYQDNITDEMPERERHQKLTSTEAYMAFSGVQPTMYDPASISTNSPTAQTEPYMPRSTGESNGSPGNRTSSATTAKTIMQDQEDYNKAVAEFQAETGVNIDGLNPMARSAYLSNLRDQGISPPSMPTRLRLYYQWRDEQPPGSDSSPEKYIEWLESQ